MNKFPIALAGLTPAELEEQLSGLKRFRAVQIYKWIARGADDFSEMSDIPLSLREELKSRFTLFSAQADICHEEAGAKKIVVSLKDGLKIEAVLLKDGKGRLTACLSTQAGCPVGCVFCKTGSLGFSRDLDCGEIVEQFLFLRNIAQKERGQDGAKSGGAHINGAHVIENIVIMGMGEPLLNLENLRKAIAIFSDKTGINFSKRRITVSTCGVCAGLFDIAENGPYVRLALSLVTGDEPLRQKLMPLADANPLAKVKEALAIFQKKSGGRVTLEAPLLGGVNTRDKDAQSIAQFAQGLDTVVNIIPWNPVAGLEFEGSPLREPDKNEVENFARLLESSGLKVTMRRRKGRGVNGACGQLGSLSK